MKPTDKRSPSRLSPEGVEWFTGSIVRRRREASRLYVCRRKVRSEYVKALPKPNGEGWQFALCAEHLTTFYTDEYPFCTIQPTQMLAEASARSAHGCLASSEASASSAQGCLALSEASDCSAQVCLALAEASARFGLMMGSSANDRRTGFAVELSEFCQKTIMEFARLPKN